MKKAYTPTDFLYCFMLVVTLMGSATVVAFLAGAQELLDWLVVYDEAVPYAGLGLGISPVAGMLLALRTWMACRYRPCPALPNGRLPLVTVVIPAYNEGRQVLDTIRSVLASDYPAAKLAVIGVDDGSCDDTWDWMLAAKREFPHRLQLVQQPRNMGKRHALLAGFRLARGDVFVTIDSDSLILPDTLRQLVSPLAASPRVGAVAGNVRVLNRADGAIPKMLDVSFTMSFDFLRRGQGSYGGVLCTPGALSAYRRSAVAPFIEAWADQTFMGRPATIGEDRALTNIVLSQGLRVAYQKDAVVLTTVPTHYRGLYKMLLRWARSNVRETLVMLRYLPRRFRRGDSGGGWVRLSGLVSLTMLPTAETLKVAGLTGLLLAPVPGARALFAGCLTAALIPVVVYQFRERGLFGLIWGVAYCFFWMFTLSWISLWGLATAAHSGWLTRGPGQRPRPAVTVAKPAPDLA